MLQLIGLSVPYARNFLSHAGVGFNLYWPQLQTADGEQFMKEAQEAGRKVFIWTVNADDAIKYDTIFPRLWVKLTRVPGGRLKRDVLKEGAQTIPSSFWSEYPLPCTDPIRNIVSNLCTKAMRRLH